MMNVAPVLLVDDDLEFRALVCEALAHEGYYTLAVSSGEMALEVLESTQPSLLLVDVNLPTMSGPEFVRQAHGRGAVDLARVVMLSACALECDSPARWRLAKPIDFRLLLRVVEDLCGTGQLASLWGERGVPHRLTAASRRALPR
jgi:CheY-like chemotaxis protein